MIPAREGWPPKLQEIDFYSVPDNILCESLEKRFLRLQLVEGGEDEIHAKNTNRLLLQDIRRISQIYVQENVVRGTAWLELKPKPHPAISIIRPGIVARGDGIGERKKASLQSASFA